MRAFQKLFDKIRAFRWGYVLLSLLLVGLGICFIVGRPSDNNKGVLDAMAIAIGALTMLYAAIFLFFTLVGKGRGFIIGIKIAFSIVVLITGFVALISREATVTIILDVLGLVLVVDGAFKLNTSIQCRRYVVLGWWIILWLAFLLIGGGFVILMSCGGFAGIRTHTIPSALWIYWVLAFLLFAEAIANFLSAFYLTSYERHERVMLRAEFCRDCPERATEEEAEAEVPAEVEGGAEGEQETAADESEGDVALLPAPEEGEALPEAPAEDAVTEVPADTE